MMIAAESSKSPILWSAALAIIAEYSTSPSLQLAAYPTTISVAAASERSATVATVVASATVTGVAVEWAGNDEASTSTVHHFKLHKVISACIF